MFYVASSLLLVALALNAENAFGANQHLICKTVDDVFGDGTLSQASIRPQAIQGPPGKRGQTGVKGQPGISGSKGEQGVPGLVDPQDIDNVVEEKMRAVTGDFRERIETLEEKVLELNANKQDILLCDGGERFFKSKCYNVILHARLDVNYANARELCTAKGGIPADILNAKHQSLVAEYVGKKTTRGVNIWLGMSYRISTRTLRFSNGNDVTGDAATTIGWWSGHPRTSSSYEAVAMYVNPTANGLQNYPPTTNLHGVLCEK